jgi:hypothetical protein
MLRLKVLGTANIFISIRLVKKGCKILNMFSCLMLQAISYQFKFMRILLPFPFTWIPTKKELQFHRLSPQLMPWYFSTFVILPIGVVVCLGLLIYEIVSPVSTMNGFQIIASIVVAIVGVISTISAATFVHFGSETVAGFREMFIAEKQLLKGSKHSHKSYLSIICNRYITLEM